MGLLKENLPTQQQALSWLVIHSIVTKAWKRRYRMCGGDPTTQVTQTSNRIAGQRRDTGSTWVRNSLLV